MRLLAVVAFLSACVHRVETTRVTLYDRSELAIEGAGTLPATGEGRGATGLVDNDAVLVGRSADVLAFDGDRLRMRLIQDEPYCRRVQRCERAGLDLRIDTPLANVRSIHAVGVVADHRVIPLGVLAGSLLTVLGGGMIAYELAEHARGSLALVAATRRAPTRCPR